MCGKRLREDPVGNVPTAVFDYVSNMDVEEVNMNTETEKSDFASILRKAAIGTHSNYWFCTSSYMRLLIR